MTVFSKWWLALIYHSFETEVPLRKRRDVVVAMRAHIPTIVGSSLTGAYIFMSSESFLLFRAVSHALMVLNYSHWVMLGSGTGVGNQEMTMATTRSS